MWFNQETEILKTRIEKLEEKIESLVRWQQNADCKKGKHGKLTIADTLEGWLYEDFSYNPFASPLTKCEPYLVCSICKKKAIS